MSSCNFSISLFSWIHEGQKLLTKRVKVGALYSWRQRPSDLEGLNIDINNFQIFWFYECCFYKEALVLHYVNVIFYFKSFVFHSRIWLFLCVYRVNIRACIFNNICKPTISTEIQAISSSWSFASTVFWGGGAIVHKFPNCLQGTTLYRAQDPKTLSQIGSIHQHTPPFPSYANVVY